MLLDLASELGSGLAYGAIGILLLAAGYVVIDLVTPGKLGDLIYTERNANAAWVVASGLLAIGAIVAVAIISSHDDFVKGIAYTAGYGGLGVVLLGLSFLLIDRFTPGELGVICTDVERHPAVMVTVAAHLSLGAIIAAAIS